jgi:hypothetical protein
MVPIEIQLGRNRPQVLGYTEVRFWHKPAVESGQSMSALPSISDINLFRYCQGVIDLDAEIPDRAFDLGVPEQQLDGPEVARPPIDQGSFCASQRMRAK